MYITGIDYQENTVVIEIDVYASNAGFHKISRQILGLFVFSPRLFHLESKNEISTLQATAILDYGFWILDFVLNTQNFVSGSRA